MTTIQEIKKSLPSFSTTEIYNIERVIHDLYRESNEPVIYDDAYGVWTEYDQTSAASEVFELLDKNKT